MANDEWCPFAIRRDGPSNKHGYSFAPSPSPKRGIVPHSMEGTLAGAFGRLDSQVQPRVAWQFSIAKDGTLYQHYEVSANCWGSGDTDDDGGVRANIDLDSCEFEGVRGETLLLPQVVTFANLYIWEEEEHNFLPYQTWLTVYEHKWVSDSPTSCPSNRIPHDLVIATINELKEPVTMPAEDKLTKVMVKTATDPAIYLTDWVLTRHIRSMNEFNFFNYYAGIPLVTITDELMDSLLDFTQYLADPNA